jgi:aldehyde dehydrogenase (NAD+)
VTGGLLLSLQVNLIVCLGAKQNDRNGSAVNQINAFRRCWDSRGHHYFGKYGFDALTHAKSMFISPPDVDIDHLFPPYTKETNEQLKI